MIKSFADSDTEALFGGKKPRKYGADVVKRMLNKLQIINAASILDDLRSPPGNRLELLSGDRDGQHSIRVNDQWRICFVWHGADAYDVEITDYH